MARKEIPPLVASAKRSVWRMHDHADEADKAFRQLRKSILESYDYTCVYCEMRAERFQEVHHSDDDHKNNDPANLLCTCPLCHQVFHLGLAGMKEGGDLVYVPELGQAELNQLVLVSWLVTETDAARFSNPQERLAFSRLSGRANSILALLENRRGAVLLKLRGALKSTKFPPEYIEKIKLSHITPNLLATVLMSLDEKDYARRQELLGGLRLLPKPARFRARIKLWAAEQDGVRPPATWERLLATPEIEDIVVRCTQEIAILTAGTGG